MPFVGDVQFELPAMWSLRLWRALRTASTEFEYTVRFVSGDIVRSSTIINLGERAFCYGNDNCSGDEGVGKHDRLRV